MEHHSSPEHLTAFLLLLHPCVQALPTPSLPHQSKQTPGQAAEWQTLPQSLAPASPTMEHPCHIRPKGWCFSTSWNVLTADRARKKGCSIRYPGLKNWKRSPSSADDLEPHSYHPPNYTSTEHSFVLFRPVTVVEYCERHFESLNDHSLCPAKHCRSLSAVCQGLVLPLVKIVGQNTQQTYGTDASLLGRDSRCTNPSHDEGPRFDVKHCSLRVVGSSDISTFPSLVGPKLCSLSTVNR